MIYQSDRVDERRAWAQTVQTRRSGGGGGSATDRGGSLDGSGGILSKTQLLTRNPIWVFLVSMFIVSCIVFSLDRVPTKVRPPDIDHRLEVESQEHQLTSSTSPNSTPSSSSTTLRTRDEDVVYEDRESIARNNPFRKISCAPGSSLLGCHLCLINGEEGKTTELDTQGIIKSQTQAAFDNIYKKKIWGEGGLGSGVGSTVENAQGAAYALRMIMYKYALTRIMDAPCGALAWTEGFIRDMRKEIPCFTYTGVDIVPSVIEDNKRLFKDDPSYTSFFVRDISDFPKQKLPRGQQLILSRDTLQHLSMPLIRTSIKQYCASDATYLAVGSYISAKKNKNRNIQTGMAFSINLLAPPFNFPEPMEYFNERTRDGKYLLLYNLHPDFCEAKAVVDFVNGGDSGSEQGDA